MPRQRSAFVCAECGADQPKWSGQCPACGAWNTLRAMQVPSDGIGARPRTSAQAARAVPLSEIDAAGEGRTRLGVQELDRVLGGGVVPGSLILVGGEPGIGKSTLLLQVAALLSATGAPVLYVSAEESGRQVRLRSERLVERADAVHVLCETDLDAAMAEVLRIAPQVLVVDSVQTVYLPDVASAAGSVAQVRECAARLMRYAKREGVTVFLVGHVTKSGDIAGPRVLEHMVDVVLYLEGRRSHGQRILRCTKNRFGATSEVGVFEMKDAGMVPVANPSAAFLEERLPGVPGSAVMVTVEGTRPLLVEVQALVSRSGGQVPRRTANGVELNRLLLLAAVLGKRAGVPLGAHDVFVNVVGGLRVTEPAVDLAVAAAVASSARGRPIADDTVVFGEVGLSGELRSVGHMERRLREAAGLGYRRALVPRTGLDLPSDPPLRALGARTLHEALEIALSRA